MRAHNSACCPALILVAFVAIVQFSTSSYVQAQGVAPVTPLWDEVIQSFNNYSGLPSAGLTIGRRDVGIVLNITKGGWSFTQPVLVASASKLTSSMAIWTLIQDGTMSLDDNPQKYLSWWTNDTSDLRSRVKLSQLLAFTSGFNGEYNCTASYTHEECVQLIYSDGLSRVPGMSYNYGGDHLQIAGLMAVKAAGYSNWNELFNARVKIPTGAQGSAVYTPAGSTNSRIAGGLLTSTNTYIQMFMGFYTPTLYNSTTLELMQQDRTGAGVTILSRPPGVEEIGQDWHYCASFWYECPLPIFNATCANQKVFSSPGAFGFTPSVDRVNDYWMVISQYQTQGAPDAVFWSTSNRDKIVRVLNQLYPPPTVATPIAAPTSATVPSTVPYTAPSSNVPTTAQVNSPSASSGPKASSASPLAMEASAMLLALSALLSVTFMYTN